ncbi:MAG: DUF5050 domain-containing protein [Clostridiales bacterium]|nr:DUF5050 domain-containing protein [Clostridiales bacterium]
MRRFTKLSLIVVLFVVLAFALTLIGACNDTPETPSGPPAGSTEPNDPTPTDPVDPSKKTITGVTFDNLTVTYDGEEHEITVSGTIPEDVTVQYVNNKGTKVGVYNATATLSGEGYNTLTLTAKLTINKATITGVTFSSLTVTYDGNEHEITVSGTIPEGVSVSYESNKGTNAGTYNATATLSGECYNTLTLEAKLIINKAQIEGVTLSDNRVEYDQLSHSIFVVGNVPAGVTVKYLYDGEEATGVTTVGKHTVTAILSGDNYVTLKLNATLTIYSNEQMLYVAFFNGEIYFQNSLDGNKLYRVSNGNVTKVSNDVATYFATNGSALYFYSGGLLNQSIKSLTTGQPTSVFNPGRATYLTCDNDGNIYYAKANLIDTKGENGIYKVNVNSDDQSPVRLTTDKADYIAYYGGYIYYSNTSDGSRLYRISVTANNGNGTKLHDNKVSDILVEDGDVFFTEHTLTGSSIHKYHISNGQTTKLCVDNGAYLTKVGEYIYYVNKDLVTSNIFGKGIYRVSVSGNLLTGEKVLESNDGDGYFALASDSVYLYYYKLSDQHLYRYNTTTEAETDLMRNFQPVEDTPTFSAYPYAHLATYKGEIYYTNVLDGNSLYKYNPQTKGNFKVLTDNVSNVYFNGNYMYYSTYIVTNYALWRLDLSNVEAEPEKISSHRYEHLIFEGDYIYALRVQPPIIVGQENTNRIVRMDLDGQNETELYKKKNVHITKLFLLNGQFHFTINPAVGYKYIYTHNITDGLEDATSTNIKSDNFVIYGNRYYYFDHTSKGFKSCMLDGTDVKTIATDLEVTDLYLNDGVVYYTSTNSKTIGIYAYDIATGATIKLTNKVGHGLTVANGQLYFISISITYSADYPSKGDGDGHLYSINLSNNTLTKLA